MIVRIGELSREEYERILNRWEDADVAEAIRAIVERVRKEGDKAVRFYTKKFDGKDVEEFEVGRKAIKRAYEKVGYDFLEAISAVIKNVEKAQKRILEEVKGPRIPISRAGIYVPSGIHPYPSTAVMGVVPAKVAGVEEVVVSTPGKEEIWVAAWEAGADRIFNIGGPQAIAALASGTESIPKVDKIFGPGSKWVTEAKRYVAYRGYCQIDFPAGPSEILILADSSADPELIVVDLLASREHGPGSFSILVTTSRKIGEEVLERIEKFGDFPILLAESMKEAIDFSNDFAPEHLEIMTRDDEKVAKKIRYAGAVFLGSPSTAGDYFGPNHILPTGRGARVFSPLSVEYFLVKPYIQKFSRQRLRKIEPYIDTLTKVEGMNFHRKAIKMRR